MIFASGHAERMASIESYVPQPKPPTLSHSSTMTSGFGGARLLDDRVAAGDLAHDAHVALLVDHGPEGRC